MRRAVRWSAWLLALTVLNTGVARADGPAQAIATPSVSWHRIVAPEGESLSVPCPETKIKRASPAGQFAAMCYWQGVTFAFGVGKLGNTGPSDFDQLVADARKHLAQGELTLTTVADHRAFRVASTHGFAVGEIVDYQPGKVIRLGATEQYPGPIDIAHRPAMLEIGRKFIASLDIQTK